MNDKDGGKILVIGATGTVGSEVLKQLVSISSGNNIKAGLYIRKIKLMRSDGPRIRA